MNLYADIVSKKEKISVIGLGYVGLPVAIAFAKKAEVIGFDVNVEKIKTYENGIDPTNEVGDEAIRETTLAFTSDAHDLKQAKFHIVAVPTPICEDKVPDLSPLRAASQALGKNLVKGSVVVYESTVYPGLTEEICVPLLEEASGLTCGVDFKVGYSPERINPGDQQHRLENIVKVVAGMDAQTLQVVSDVYRLVVEAGVYQAESIKVAEAAKVIENAQRDVNIAFMNELALIFDRLDIDTQAVLEAAGTKWNFLNFRPGLVGGHCIGVDPYYLTYKAARAGYQSQVILSGRRINDDMGRYVVERLIKKLIQADVRVKGARVGLFGLTFKENCPDTRNTRVIDIVQELETYGVSPLVFDPVADEKEAFEIYGLPLAQKEALHDLDAIVLAVSHDVFKAFTLSDWSNFYKKDAKKVMLDVKGALDKPLFKAHDFDYWRL